MQQYSIDNVELAWLDPNRSGTVAVVVDQESKLHQRLKTIAKSERNPATRDKVANMVLKDLTSSEQITWVNAFVMTARTIAPDISQVSAADKQNRVLTLTVEVTLAGAIQQLIPTVNVTL